MTKVSRHAKICSYHFNASCFKTYKYTGHRILEKNAVPVFFGKEDIEKR